MKSIHRQTRVRSAALCAVEQLETRRMLSVAPHVAGQLDGKVVYTQGGHGYVWRNGSPGFWGFMRPYLNTMVEDLGNEDQIQPFADNLLHAGATVVSMRPVGHQVLEAVVDNTDTFSAQTGGFQVVSGSWTGSNQTPYWKGAASGYDSVNNLELTNHYVSATTSLNETAVARFTPNITTAGFYPVYTWYNNGSNRPRDATYRINYAGGSIEVKVAQDLTGKGWVYLGTYYFAAGVNPTSGSVDVSNKSATAGKAVIADAIRFGNGMGDWTENGTHPASGKPREDEPALYWCYDERGWDIQNTRVPTTVVYGGSSTDDETKNFSACDKYATYMNDSSVGTMNDRLWISFHSNAAGSGSGRGTLGLINDPPTPHQAYLANLAGTTVQNEMTALNPTHEFNWGINNPPTFTGGYSEISNNVINGEFDATIIEVAFHDNSSDSQLLKDPQVRWDVGRSATHTAIQYFDNFDGSNIGAAGNNDASYIYTPEPPMNVRTVTDSSGNVTVQWAPGTSSPGLTGPYGNAPTGYRVWKSTNGYGFDLVTTVGNVTSFQIAGLPTNAMTYFMVTAINAGGESLNSYTVVGKPQAAHRAPVLIVNNFKRVDDDGDQGENWVGIGNPIYRARIRYNNSFDYVVQAGEAIESAIPALGVESCTDDAIAGGQINLGDYQTVIWMSGEQSTTDETFTSVTQPLVANYLAAGGKMFISGSEIAWDLFGQANETQADRTFLQSTLHVNFSADDANTYSTAAGINGSALAGVPALNFDNGTHGTYDVDFPDVLTPGSNATVAMNYSTGAPNAAVIQYASGNTKLLFAGFPFESIYDPAQRVAMMTAVLNYFGTNSQVDTLPPSATVSAPPPTPGAPTYDFTVTYSDSGTGVNPATFDGSDVFVTGPGNFSAPGSFVSAVGNVVTYRITAPGSAWDPFDNGTYQIQQNGNQVSDMAGNFRPAGNIGSFVANTPFAYVFNNVLHGWFMESDFKIAVVLNGGGSNVDVTQNPDDPSPVTLSFPSANFTSIQMHGTAGTDIVDFSGNFSQSITFKGGLGGDELIVRNGNYTFNSDLSANNTNLDLTLDAGSSVTLGSSEHLDDLTIKGDCTLTAGGSKVIVCHTIAFGPIGNLDLNDNDLIVNYSTESPLSTWTGTQYDGITGRIATGVLHSSADTGSLYALGAAEASDVLTPTGGFFDNETVDGTAVLVKFTYTGDATLDGKINIDDYTRIDSGVAAMKQFWSNGDFNYDGKVNIDDYVLIDGNVSNQTIVL